jgi:NAD(P)-dependent dehydrogenase (short-subunit alcohol dehydrogenase family)
MRRDLSESVVVITGASSGIGRAAALQFAEQGSRLVLAARRREALDDLARQCEALGGRAVSYALDVSNEDAVRSLARHAVDSFGRIDVWVNNAAVTLFGRFEEIPSEAFRRVVDVNFFGYVNGARAVMPYFREQGHGVLINVSSVVGEIGQPFTTAYASTKWAIRGFSESLRMELSLDEAPDIHVCTVLPASIDTPLFQQGANFFGRRAKPMRPIYDADLVASTIVKLAKHPKREVFVGGVGPALRWQHFLAPRMTELSVARQVNMDHFLEEAEQPNSGNIWEPMWGYETISGGWTPSQTGAAVFALPAVLTAVAGVGGWFLLNLGRRRRPPETPLQRARRQVTEAARPVQQRVSRQTAAARKPARRAIDSVRQTVGA